MTTWFNLSCPRVLGIRLWNLFRRHMEGGDKASGAGMLQIRSRHLFYVGRVETDGEVRYPISLLFVWLTGARP